MAEIVVDSSEYPLLIVRYPAGFSLADFDVFAEKLTQEVLRGTCAMIIDTKNASLDAAQRKHMAEHMKKHAIPYSERVRGCAVVLTSTVTRGVITALNWLVSSPYPVKTFATEAEARAWCSAQLQNELTNMK